LATPKNNKKLVVTVATQVDRKSKVLAMQEKRKSSCWQSKRK
jgi:hypothetical protein